MDHGGEKGNLDNLVQPGGLVSHDVTHKDQGWKTAMAVLHALIKLVHQRL